MSLVVCRLPKAGLGNHLFPLMNAMVFARLNNLPLKIIGYHHLKIGPYLRREKIKRRYIGYFTFQKSFIGEAFDRFYINLVSRRLTCVPEPAVDKLEPGAIKDKLFLFEKLPTYHDYFVHLKPHRVLVRELLRTVIQPDILEKVENTLAPVIGVHIRMGDFRKLKEGEDFSKVGHVRTPEFYFTNIIKEIRKIAGSDLPVSLFTDGYRHEFEEILDMDHVEMVEGNPDIVDLLLLSRSQLIIMATGSTFSYWSGFLSEAPIIKHPEHIHAPFRDNITNSKVYEGLFDLKNPDPLLIRNIREISLNH